MKRTYARVELERRFLVERLPATLDRESYERLEDLFVEGAHLRLRRVRRPTGELIVAKLGHKIPDPDAPDDPRRRLMTTIYLPEHEAAALAALHGVRATKRRYKLTEQGATFSVDVWESPHAARGTIVAEVEAPTLEVLCRIETPSWALREVTSDPDFTAIALAAR